MTLQNVAKLAGVSLSAASVAINGTRSGTRLSAEKRRHIIEVAANAGYRPNGIARALVRGRTNIIGVYTGESRLDSRNTFFAEVLGGVFDAASTRGFNTTIYTTGRTDSDLVEFVSSRSFDGLILHASPNDPILTLLHDLRIPAVAIADAVTELPSVVVDDYAGGVLQAEHLAALGHKHVLLKLRMLHKGSAFNRMDAFKERAQALGMKVSESLETLDILEGLSVEDIGLMTRSEDRVSAIVAWQDDVALSICHKLTSMGISVPEKVAVVGFNGFRHLFEPKLRLTSIYAPWSEVAIRATAILCDLIEGRAVPATTTLPVQFVRGATT